MFLGVTNFFLSGAPCKFYHSGTPRRSSFKVDGESSLSGIIAASLLLDAGLFLEAGSLVRSGSLVRASLLLRSGLLLHASLLRLRFLARDFLEHYFHPLAAHCDP
jgi:hypothetical protein